MICKYGKDDLVADIIETAAVWLFEVIGISSLCAFGGFVSVLILRWTVNETSYIGAFMSSILIILMVVVEVLSVYSCTTSSVNVIVTKFEKYYDAKQII